jgi:cytoskeletal protein CcmA (bactofilin family)
VDSAADVFIGPEGSFEGTLRARSVRVSGHARGNMQCEHLEILPGGIVTGEVDAQALIITPGGRFLGESVQRGTYERALAVAVAS